MLRQRTLKNVIRATGVGLHSGEKVYLTLRPAPVDAGIVFRRVDLDPVVEIPARADLVTETMLCTGLSRDAGKVMTVEHLMSALAGLGIDNAYVDLSAPEVPIMDGSAAPFIYLIQEAGVKPLTAARRYLKVLRPMSLTRGDKRIAVYPSDHFKVTYSISFDHPLLRHQSRTLRISEESFVEDIAPARTFGFLKEVEMLRQRGLALGGSLDNAIVLGDTGVLNNALRFEDEFVRHKILDVLGDLALVGYPVVGHVVAHRGGHALHTAFAAKILTETDAWRLVETPVDPELVGLPVAVPAGARALVERSLQAEGLVQADAVPWLPHWLAGDGIAALSLPELRETHRIGLVWRNGEDDAVAQLRDFAAGHDWNAAMPHPVIGH